MRPASVLTGDILCTWRLEGQRRAALVLDDGTIVLLIVWATRRIARGQRVTVAGEWVRPFSAVRRALLVTMIDAAKAAA